MKKRKTAKVALQQLHEAFEAIDALTFTQEKKFTALLQQVHGHAMNGEPLEGPLGLSWHSLRRAAVCESLFEQMTGRSIDPQT